jgi:KaiC/GvpD/RAD55 family RecA-like ATPase
MSTIKSNQKEFGWNLENFEKKDLLQLIDQSQQLYRPIISDRYNQSPKLVMNRLLGEIKQQISNFGTKRLAIDPINSAIIHQRYPTDKRLEILELFRILRTLDCTSLITSEVSSKISEGDFFVEEYLADGVIVLQKTLKNFKMIKTIRIEKMRGVKHDDDPRRYEITKNGITVYDTEPVII